MSGIEWAAAGALLAASLAFMVLGFGVHRIRELGALNVMYVFHLTGTVLPAVVFLQDPAKPRAETFLWMSLVSALLIPIGGLLADLVAPRAKGAPASLLGAAARSRTGDESAARAYLLLLSFGGSILFLLILRSAESIPLSALVLQGAAKGEYIEMRTQVTSLGYFQGISQRFYMPFLFTLVVLMWPALRGRIGWMTVGIGAACMAVASNALPGNKTPLATMFVMALLVWIHNRLRLGATSTTRKRLSFKMLLSLGAILGGVIGFPLYIYSLLPAGDYYSTFELLYKVILVRVFMNPAENSYFAFEYFPFHDDFTYFSDIGKLMQVLGGKFYEIATTISLYKGQGLDNYAPPTSIGTFYAQAGIPMVIVGFLLAAGIFRALDNVWASQKRAGAVELATYIVILFGAFRFSWAYFHTILLTETIVPAIAALLLWRLVRNTLAPAKSVREGPANAARAR